MGLFDRLRRRGLDDPVRGTAQVVSCSQHRGDGIWQTCHMELVVSGDGVVPQAVSFNGLAHHRRWPFPGMTLPVTVDRADPSSFKIEWDEVPDARDRAQSAAEAMAAALRGEHGSGTFTSQNVQIVGDVSSLTDEQRDKLRMLGIDLDALMDAAPAEATFTAAPAGDDAADEARLARLERLAALRAQGVLTDAEFEEQKRRILD